jgi:plasmid stability protein
LTALTSTDIIPGVASQSLEVKFMPSLSVRKIDEKTLSQLRMQAAKHGVSMEEEVRQIIKRAVTTPENLGDLAVRLFCSAYNGEGLSLPEREVHDPLKF